MGTTIHAAIGGARATAGSPVSSFHRLIGRVGDALLRARRRRATIEELRRLDDRMLADIGLTRAGIGVAVGELYGRTPSANENEPPLAA
ncbi:MAG: DUF1127 domain-containing protein [Rhodospirillaceae bacterium]|mgnify:CR=1 FL=1|jgi:uncharacterized protein YjiS (DUF1127 family)|nr:DUF1127 domain-containing protein [Rhodospirillaceae bacterium]